MRKMSRTSTMLVVAVTALTLAACSSSGQHPQSSAKPKTYASESASAIAHAIHGCEDVAAGSVGKGTMASTATCTLDGRTLVVNSWTTKSDAADVRTVLEANSAEYYYAAGPTWTVTPGDDPTIQMQLTNDAGGLMAAGLDSSSGGTADLPGERSSARAVVAALGGSVIHVEG